MMRRLLYIYVAIVAGLCVSCDDIDDTADWIPPLSGYDQSDLQQDFYADQDYSNYFDFVATQEWTVELSEEGAWLGVSQMYGEAGVQQLELTINEENTTGTPRTIYITITPQSEEYSITITATQSADLTPAQTTIMYFMGTNLSYYYNTYNIPDVRAAVSAGALGSKGRLFIYIPSSSSAELYEIYQSESGEYATQTIKTYSSKESLTQARMTEVLNETMSYASAPTSTYNIVFSGHGTGWVPYSSGLLRSTALYSFEKDPNAMMTRFMGCSEDGYMDISDMASALEATGVKYGYLLFDMCLMSNIETIYQLREVCDNVVASAAEVMGVGFPYETVLSNMFTDNGTSYDLAAVCEEYYNDSTYATVAYCVTSELDDMAAKIKEMTLSDVSISTLQCYEKLTNHIFCDLGDYIYNACSDEDLKGEFTEILNRAFPTDGRYHTTYAYSGLSGASGSFYINSEKYSGVSTSAPSTATSTTWSSTDWAVATTP